MNVDRMRAIDFHLGKPLCFCATLLLRLVWWCSGKKHRQPDQSAAKNILLIELSEMGSAILVDPAMRELSTRGGTVFFAIFAKNKHSLDLLGTVPEQRIFCLRETSLWLLVWDTLRLLLWCRRQQIDAVIDLELFSRFTALLCGFSGASKRVGFYRFHNEGLYRGEMLSHKVAYNPHVHISKNFLALVHALFATAPEHPYSKVTLALPKLTKRPRNKQEMAEVRNSIAAYTKLTQKTKLVLINANASDMLPQRRWPMDRFAVLIGMLLRHDSNLVVLLTGSPQERAELDKLATAVADKRCINFAGAITFIQLPALYEQATMMITNDSGPAHFAAVTSMPTFVLFGPETPDLYASLGDTTPIYAKLHCSPCVSAWNHRKTSCSDNQCLKAITPKQVFDTVKPKLALIASKK